MKEYASVCSFSLMAFARISAIEVLFSSRQAAFHGTSSFDTFGELQELWFGTLQIPAVTPVSLYLCFYIQVYLCFYMQVYLSIYLS